MLIWLLTITIIQSCMLSVVWFWQKEYNSVKNLNDVNWRLKGGRGAGHARTPPPPGKLKYLSDTPHPQPPPPAQKISVSTHMLYVENNVYVVKYCGKYLSLESNVSFDSFSRIQLWSTYRPPKPWTVRRMLRPYISPTKSIQLYIFHKH